MKAMGSPNFVPDQIETCTMSYTAVSYLKKLKNQVHIAPDHHINACMDCIVQQTNFGN